jgi:hypothetical protein
VGAGDEWFHEVINEIILWVPSRLNKMPYYLQLLRADLVLFVALFGKRANQTESEFVPRVPEQVKDGG